MRTEVTVSSHPADGISRRAFLNYSSRALASAALAGGSVGASAAIWTAGKREFEDRSARAPALPVALLRCASYEPRVRQHPHFALWGYGA